MATTNQYRPMASTQKKDADTHRQGTHQQCSDCHLIFKGIDFFQSGKRGSRRSCGGSIGGIGIVPY